MITFGADLFVVGYSHVIGYSHIKNDFLVSFPTKGSWRFTILLELNSTLEVVWTWTCYIAFNNDSIGWRSFNLLF